MFEKLIDKNLNPSYQNLLEFSGEVRELWERLEKWLSENYDIAKRAHCSKYDGWGINYQHGKILVCDIYTERNAFVVFFQIWTEKIEKLQSQLSDYTLQTWEQRYVCGKGGWMRYRVTKEEQLTDIYKLLSVKVKPKNRHTS